MPQRSEVFLPTRLHREPKGLFADPFPPGMSPRPLSEPPAPATTPGQGSTTGIFKVYPTILTVLFFCLLTATPAWSVPVTVTPVSLADFDVLLTQTEQCVVVAMASWCGPCKTELPYLVRLYREYKKDGLVLFGLSLDFAGAQAMQPVVNKYGVDFPVYWAGEAAVGHYGLNPIPMLVFFRNGRVIDRVQGVHDEEELRAILSGFLKRNDP